MEWEWIELSVVLAIHECQLERHGGGTGVRDVGLLESALNRAQQFAAYGEPDAVTLAAAYAYGIAKNHPFVDGNKRTAWVACELFFELNGYQLAIDEADAYAMALGAAHGSVGETEFAEWLRRHIQSGDQAD